MHKIILMTGIHGVGKSHISEKIIEKLNIPIYSASSLIRMYNYKSDDDKRVEDINKNQKILTENIKKNISNKLFILDSHTCLLDLNNNIVKISHKWLMKLNVVGVILLYDDLEKIKKRLYERDNLDFDISFLERFQECEKENVVNFAKKNGIPFIEFKNSDSLNILLDFIVTIK